MSVTKRVTGCECRVTGYRYLSDTHSSLGQIGSAGVKETPRADTRSPANILLQLHISNNATNLRNYACYTMLVCAMKAYGVPQITPCSLDDPSTNVHTLANTN
jgi:hypothetical protein